MGKREGSLEDLVNMYMVIGTVANRRNIIYNLIDKRNPRC